MGTFGVWHILILATVALVLFGSRGRVSDLMGDVGRGISSFKRGLNEKEPPRMINADDADEKHKKSDKL